MATRHWLRGFAYTASLCLLLLAAPAWAEPGDEKAVAQARKDYAEAMKGHDPGLQNAMRAELAAQLEMAKKRVARKKSLKAVAPAQHARSSN